VGAETLIIIGGAAAVLLGAAVWGARKLGFFTSEHSVGSTDEDADAFGKIVRVTESLSDTHTGRIFFQGTSWPARAVHGSAQLGDRVRIVDRENLVWIVEPLALPPPHP